MKPCLFLLCLLFADGFASFQPREVEFIRNALGDTIVNAKAVGLALGRLLGKEWEAKVTNKYMESIVPHIDKRVTIGVSVPSVIRRLGLSQPGSAWNLQPTYTFNFRLYPSHIRRRILESLAGIA